MFNCGPAIFCPIQRPSDLWNPSSPTTGGLITLTNGGHTANNAGSAPTGTAGALGNAGQYFGKLYLEITWFSTAGFSSLVRADVGLTRTGTVPVPGGVTLSNLGIAYRRGGVQITDSIQSATGLTPAGSAYVAMFAVDFAASKAWVGLNGLWCNGGDPAAGTTPITSTLVAATYYPFMNIESGQDAICTLRTVNSDFAYPVPTGFSSWT